jgi:hypothetical protein
MAESVQAVCFLQHYYLVGGQWETKGMDCIVLKSLVWLVKLFGPATSHTHSCALPAQMCWCWICCQRSGLALIVLPMTGVLVLILHFLFGSSCCCQAYL